MYAVIKTGGKQYKVGTGDKLKVEKLNAAEGDTVEFDKVLLLRSDDKIEAGKPYVEGRKVVARVIAHGRHKKINILKFKRRKHHMKRQGHRQYYTEVEITDIS
ncbi:large subunit ribosomal protein L21 [Methylomarinovum tepidoasis]|uniref:Large ribosomal subunit protein bL21 n=1 Tax=Methylomarinovum tepidoasis TaxID=2840183 RepID=A0AAU9CDT1_9GAMM|nr:50S ribosomal protein L21 [Methylomarinovum sp. IN45]BCX88343.1 large subunit ribosomal protein L21 [Methylomarinovum sp. IN45]